MYKKILVPLDGSKLAECVLPHVESIAQGCGAETIILIRVLESNPYRRIYADQTITDEESRKLSAEHKKSAKDYLDEVAKGVKAKGNIKTELISAEGEAEAIADYATKNDVDLIVIATHGRSGVSRWIWGSMADRILRSACVPVLMIRAPGCVPGI